MGVTRDQLIVGLVVGVVSSAILWTLRDWFLATARSTVDLILSPWGVAGALVILVIFYYRRQAKQELRWGVEDPDKILEYAIENSGLFKKMGITHETIDWETLRNETGATRSPILFQPFGKRGPFGDSLSDGRWMTVRYEPMPGGHYRLSLVKPDYSVEEELSRYSEPDDSPQRAANVMKRYRKDMENIEI